MKLTRNEQLETELLKEIDDSMVDDDRSQPSVSGMIYCLTKTYNENNLVLPDENGKKDSRHTKEQTLLFITGLGLERVILSGRQIAEKGSTEGIQWHVDHLNTDTDKFIEVKSTRGSSKKSDDISEGWRKQILAYFYVSGITEGDLAILHLMGAYSPPFPEFIVWHIEATQQEVDENWAWIKNRAEIYESAVNSGVAPTPFKYNMDWECRNCSWKSLCDAKSILGGMGSKVI